MCKLRHKVCNGQKIPPKNQIRQNNFFVVILQTINVIFPQILDHIIRTVFPKLFCLFSTQSS